MIRTKLLNLSELAKAVKLDSQRITRAVKKEKPTNLSEPERNAIIFELEKAHKINVEFFTVE